MKKLLALVFILGLSGPAHAVADMVLADTQTVTGMKVFTSSRTVFSPRGPGGGFAPGFGSNADNMPASFMFDISHTTGPGLVIYNNSVQTSGENDMMVMFSTNSLYTGYFLRIVRNDTNSNGEIRIDSPNPNIEFLETDYATPAQGKFEIGINTGVSYWATRNSGDDSFERTVEFPNKGATGGGLVIKTTGTLKIEDATGSTIGFKAPNSLGASWSHDLWTTSSNADKMLSQSTNGSPRALFWSDTFHTPATLAVLTSSWTAAPSRTGITRYCTNCVTCISCTSTGTAFGAVACDQAVNRTTRCQ